MPSKGPAYPTSKEWKAAVRQAIDELRDDDGKRISDAAFAKKCKISKSALSEALSPDRVQTPTMPRINAALGWPAPRVLSTPDELEIWAIVEALSDFERGRFLEQMRTTVGRMREIARTRAARG